MSTATSQFRTPQARAALLEWYDATVAALPCEVRSRFVTTRCGETHVLEAGPADAPPVVLLHGMGLSGASWWPQLPALAARHHVFAVDVVGSSGKSAGTRPAPLSGYATWLLDVLDGLGLTRAAFVGHSLGGWMTLQLAGAPGGAERIERAVLVSSSGLSRVSARGLWKVGAAAAFAGDSLARSRAVVRQLAAPGWIPDPNVVTMFRLVLDGLVPPVVPAIAYSRRHLGRLKAPVSVLVGAHEILFAQGMLSRAAACLPGLREAAVVPGVGHCLPWEDPAELNRRILGALDAPAR